MVVPKYRTVGNNVVMRCDTCGGDVRTTDIIHVTITTTTGEFGGKWVDRQRVPGVMGARTYMRAPYPKTIIVKKSVCPGCRHTIDHAVRRDPRITVRDRTE
jgi:hypothetical protein